MQTDSSSRELLGSNTASGSLRQMRLLVSDLYGIAPATYWCDFLISAVIGYASAAIYLSSPVGIVKFVTFVIAAFAIYRLSSFMHEIAHFRRGQMTAYSVTWNLLAGVPLLMPTFFYRSHSEHHNAHHYGTHHDGEYLPLGSGRYSVLLFLSQIFFQPIFVALRFAIGTPLSFLHPKLRRWTLQHASSFVINFRYKRVLQENDPTALWALMDVLCCLRVYAIIGVVGFGFDDWTHITEIYALAVFILSINHFRTLTAHRYLNDGNRAMSHEEQLLDSVDIVGDPILTELICPVGMRYHALHHLFPTMPYHNLGRAHRRLMEKLPIDAVYRQVVRSNFLEVLREFRASLAP